MYRTLLECIFPQYMCRRDLRNEQFNVTPLHGIVLTLLSGSLWEISKYSNAIGRISGSKYFLYEQYPEAEKLLDKYLTNMRGRNNHSNTLKHPK